MKYINTNIMLLLLSLIILIQLLETIYGQESPSSPSIDEIINNTIHRNNTRKDLNNQTLTYKQFYKMHEEKAKRIARKRLNLTAYKTSKYTTIVDQHEFGETNINPKDMLECWWETLSTELITRFFLKQNFDVDKANCQSQYKETALHYCNIPQDGDKSCVAAALKIKGLEIDVIDEHGTTPLFWAVHNNYLVSAALLIDAGADMEITDNTGKKLIDHAQSDDMRQLINDPFSMAVKIITDSNEEIMDKVASLTKKGHTPIHKNKANSLNRADILGKDYNKNVIKLSMFNWDEEIHVKLQVERKPAMILFTEKNYNNCKKCKEAEHVIDVMSKSFYKNMKFYIMDAIMDEPPTPFGKQDVLPSLYYRGINGINTESKKKNHGDDDDDDGESSGMIQAIQFDGTKHGNLVNQVDVMGFIKSFL